MCPKLTILLISVALGLGGCSSHNGSDTGHDAGRDAGTGAADSSEPTDSGEDAGDAHDDAPTPADADPGDVLDDSGATDAGGDAAIDGNGDADDVDADGPPPTAAECFADLLDPPSDIVDMDYDQFSPVMGSHCLGTNHQDIQGIERVVFLGDSVTVGTPLTSSDDFYRSRLADALADHFDLEAPSGLWNNFNPIDGTALLQTDGDFSCCAKWGANTDDFLEGDEQIAACFPENTRDRTTLVIFTIGGNDIASLTKDFVDGVDHDLLWADVQDFVDHLRAALQWFYEQPTRFPNGIYVIFSNMFEFTDGTGETSACPAAALAGFNTDVENPEVLADMVVWANEQFLSIAVETGSDMIFILEHFCGHGWANDNPESPCYLGPNTPRWFDLTCTHPNAEGHGQVANMFLETLLE